MQVVYYCIWCSALGVVTVVLRSRCVVLCTVCELVSDYRCPMYRCPKHVELFTIINHNCCIKLVPLVIFIYNARSHIHQIRVRKFTLKLRSAFSTNSVEDIPVRNVNSSSTNKEILRISRKPKVHYRAHNS